MFLPLKSMQWYHRRGGDGVSKPNQNLLQYIYRNKITFISKIKVKSVNSYSYKGIIPVLINSVKSYVLKVPVFIKQKIKYKSRISVSSNNVLRYKGIFKTNSLIKLKHLLDLL